jgi:hypothetical protein
MLVLKHLSDWSFDACEREVRGSLVYRVPHPVSWTLHWPFRGIPS